MDVIRTHDLGKRYGSRVGIRSVDLRVEQGALFGFLGPNGAGKTTTIRVLLGFLRPSEGKASVLGLDCWKASARIKRDIGYLPGDLRLYPWMTVRNGLRIAGRVRGLPLETPGLDLAERFLLDPDTPVRRMSRGMRQKLGIILALAHNPRLLVLDEPTSGLDPIMQDELAACLRERAEAGKTVFFSSHTLSEVEQLCNRVGVVRTGRLVADETLDALRARARRLVRIRYSTTPESVPAFLEQRRRLGDLWEYELDGPVAELLAWLASQTIEDVSIGDPDLESLFRRYYEEDAP